MLYSIEIAQTFSAKKMIKQELFYKSMLNSFEQTVTFIIANSMVNEHKTRIVEITDET